MEEATGHIELAMEEYNVVTEHFSDIQLIDTAPDNIRRRITETADRVDNLTVDRRILNPESISFPPIRITAWNSLKMNCRVV